MLESEALNKEQKERELRPIRLVHSTNQTYKHVSVTSDDTKMMVRILTPVPKDGCRISVSSSEILTTNSLLYEYIELNGNYYYISAEGCFDKESRIGKLWWKPCANIQFIVNPILANRGKIEVISKRDCCAHSYERSTEWCSRIGYQAIAQVYVRSSNDTMEETAKSFAIDDNGMCFTNFDPKRIVETTASELRQNPLASKFLVNTFRLNTPSTVKPSLNYTFSFTVLKNKGKEVETDCDGDWWEVKCLAGYIPQRKVYVKNGVGTFRFMALGLIHGEEVEVQLLDQTGYICARKIIKVEKS